MRRAFPAPQVSDLEAQLSASRHSFKEATTQLQASQAHCLQVLRDKEMEREAADEAAAHTSQLVVS
jgi:hypothetical protein